MTHSEPSTPFLPPWKREPWWRIWLRSLLHLRQWLVLGCLVAVACMLWTYVQSHARFPAHAVSNVYVVGAPMNGMLASLLVQKGQAVKKGQTIARLDDQLHNMEWNIAKMEQKRLEGLLVAEALRFKLSQVALQANLQKFVFDAQTSWMTGASKLKASRAELRVLGKELQWLQKVRKNNLGRTATYGSLEARQHSLQVLTKAMPRLLYLFKRKQRQALGLLKRVQPRSKTEVKDQLKKVLQPLQTQWFIQTLRLKKLEALHQHMTLRAPASGVIQEVLHLPGTRVQEGSPILKLVGHNNGVLLAYLEESLSRNIQVGQQVQATLRFPNRKSVSSLRSTSMQCAKVTGLGVLEPIPLRFRTIPNKPTWVRPVSIQLEQSTSLIPGEMMFVEFSPGGCRP
ncbi:MAG: HlyD family efflux transporter periplasmic adaptor subunit [Deltaproteobacteria bacterium]|nr:MAG: HlyD family efflux transporter periplasmic adaptor subunit [Deltaproteobacteria bacterium]